MKNTILMILAVVLIGFLAAGCVKIDLVRNYENSLLIGKYEKIRSENSLDKRDKLIKCASCHQ